MSLTIEDVRAWVAKLPGNAPEVEPLTFKQEPNRWYGALSIAVFASEAELNDCWIAADFRVVPIAYSIQHREGQWRWVRHFASGQQEYLKQDDTWIITFQFAGTMDGDQ